MFSSVTELDDALTTPSPALADLFRRLPGDLTVLGVGGKMGPTLAVLAARAIREAGTGATVTGVARFSDPTARQTLEAAGVKTITADLLDPAQVATLPRTPNVVFMVARKFGTAGTEPLTWATNTLPAAHAARHFAGSRIAAFSTGCVYPLVSPDTGGCTEQTPPAPVGEYAWSCLARERVFEHAALTAGTPVCLLRLNYAIDLRYGVLHDIARAIAAGTPVDLTTAHFNCIWQRDANHHALFALEHTTAPSTALNITAPGTHAVRDTALALGAAMGQGPTFTGTPSPVAYLNDATHSHTLFGLPETTLETMIAETAHWVKSGLPSLDKPTAFQVQDGTF